MALAVETCDSQIVRNFVSFLRRKEAAFRRAKSFVLFKAQSLGRCPPASVSFKLFENGRFFIKFIHFPFGAPDSLSDWLQNVPSWNFQLTQVPTF